VRVAENKICLVSFEMWDDHGSHVEELIALPGGSRGGARRFRGSGQAATRQTHHPLTEVEIACGQPKVKLTRMPDLDRGVDFAYFVPLPLMTLNGLLRKEDGGAVCSERHAGLGAS
jgi:hypothetical protein